MGERWLLPVVGAAVPVAGAVARCAFNPATGPGYDGVLSALNPLAMASCCGAVVLLIAAPVTFWHLRQNLDTAAGTGTGADEAR
jgi:hypothetical protein